MNGNHLTIGGVTIVIFLAILSFPLGTPIFAALIGFMAAHEILFYQKSLSDYLVKWWLKFSGVIAVISVVLLIAFGIGILPRSVARPPVVVLVYVTLFTLFGVGLGYAGRALKNWFRSK